MQIAAAGTTLGGMRSTLRKWLMRHWWRLIALGLGVISACTVYKSAMNDTATFEGAPRVLCGLVLAWGSIWVVPSWRPATWRKHVIAKVLVSACVTVAIWLALSLNLCGYYQVLWSEQQLRDALADGRTRPVDAFIGWLYVYRIDDYGKDGRLRAVTCDDMAYGSEGLVYSEDARRGKTWLPKGWSIDWCDP